jgi:hypothetical protein
MPTRCGRLKTPVIALLQQGGDARHPANAETLMRKVGIHYVEEKGAVTARRPLCRSGYRGICRP